MIPELPGSSREEADVTTPSQEGRPERCREDSMCTLPDGNHPMHFDERDHASWENFAFVAPPPSVLSLKGAVERLMESHLLDCEFHGDGWLPECCEQCRYWAPVAAALAAVVVSSPATPNGQEVWPEVASWDEESACHGAHQVTDPKHWTMQPHHFGRCHSDAAAWLAANRPTRSASPAETREGRDYDEATDRAVFKALREHRGADDFREYGTCQCGWRRHEGWPSHDEHRARVIAQALAASPAAVPLPEEAEKADPYCYDPRCRIAEHRHHPEGQQP